MIDAKALLPPLPERQELDLCTEWSSRMTQLPGGMLVNGIFPPGSEIPSALVAGSDPNGAAWIASRLNRAAWLESALHNLATGLGAALVVNPAGALSALDLYVKTANLLHGRVGAPSLPPDEDPPS